MLRKIIKILTILGFCMIGAFCGIELMFFVNKFDLVRNQLSFGIAIGILGVFMIIIAYRILKPDSRGVNEIQPMFGEKSIRIFAFFLILGLCTILIASSISSLVFYWIDYRF